MIVSARVLAFLANRSALLWGDREADYPEVTLGITSGQGNQGSANTAHMMSQAGTNGSASQMPAASKSAALRL